jgi:hypothetical protein
MFSAVSSQEDALTSEISEDVGRFAVSPFLLFSFGDAVLSEVSLFLFFTFFGAQLEWFSN